MEVSSQLHRKESNREDHNRKDNNGTKEAKLPTSSSEPGRSSADDALIIQYPAKSLSRSPRTRSLGNLLDHEEKTIALSQPSLLSLALPGSFMTHFSAPSRISRSSTHQHLFTPELEHDDYSSMLPLTAKNHTEKIGFSKKVAKIAPSKRGVGNTMTILAVIAVILFLFAGYPLTIYLTRQNFHITT